MPALAGRACAVQENNLGALAPFAAVALPVRWLKSEARDILVYVLAQAYKVPPKRK
jgi:uncharacterized MAPEG superfamily protein